MLNCYHYTSNGFVLLFLLLKADKKILYSGHLSGHLMKLYNNPVITKCQKCHTRGKLQFFNEHYSR